ncbi:cytochrome c oxidase assembly protein [Nonomuraea sp. LPB2021202275-12-8]|uniref:cytochrome c oxidase assembly protein n=1 Tax=Nonomuraea sp. LPB2021202275-12-8 TaxID=3120159 RepID=UPI00300C8BE1
MTHGHGAHPVTMAVLVAVALVAAGYLVLALRERRGARGWGLGRIAAFLAGCALLVAALTGPVAALAATDFRGHMLQYLLIGMLAPLGLALGAPITLLLRTLPPAHGRRITALLRLRVLQVLSSPGMALVFTVGSLVLLYCTPLYGVLAGNPLLHVHVLLAGYLFAYVIAGPDPAPHRPSVPTRLVVLGVFVAVHLTLSQLMYAGAGLYVPAPPEQLHGAGEIMRYGGNVAELLLVLALVIGWRPSSGRRAVHRG